MAHDLVQLRRGNNEAIRNSVIIATDRNVPDIQPQDEVKQIDHPFTMIAAIIARSHPGQKANNLAPRLPSKKKSLKDKSFAAIDGEEGVSNLIWHRPSPGGVLHTRQ